MTDQEFSAKIAGLVESDSADDDAGKSHLAVDRPYYYRDHAYPNGIMRKWSDGRRELVTVDDTGDFIFVDVSALMDER